MVLFGSVGEGAGFASWTGEMGFMVPLTVGEGGGVAACELFPSFPLQHIEEDFKNSWDLLC